MSQPLWGMTNAHLAPSKIVKPLIVRTEAHVPHSARPRALYCAVNREGPSSQILHSTTLPEAQQSFPFVGQIFQSASLPRVA